MKVSDLKVGLYVIERLNSKNSDIYKVVVLTPELISFENQYTNELITHSKVDLERIFEVTSATHYLAETETELLLLKLKLDL
jgi:hypothetical protein